jgi:signal transduction histidine kinase
MNLFERIRVTLADRQRRDSTWWGRAWTRLTDWLGVVTWKRLFVVAILLLIVAGLFSAAVEEMFYQSHSSVQISTPEKPAGKSSDKKTKIIISADEKGVRVQTVPAGEAPTPPEPAVPPVPPVPPVSQGTGSASEIADEARKAAQAARETAQAARETAAEARKQVEVIAERKGVQIVVDAKGGLPADVQELLDEIKTSIEDTQQEEPPQTAAETIVKTVKPSVPALIMNLAVMLTFAMVALKVIMNTQRKAQAKVAVAEEATEREALKRQLTEARLTTMQAQVEPHFLFNTMASVDHLIEVAPQRASQMQKSLIQYLRAAMPHMRDTTSNMGREAQLVKSYLEILKFRMEERLEFAVDVPPGLASAEIPPMMLLSLVENAIKHGLEPKPEGGRIDVKAEIAHGKLRVSVADTGLGFMPTNAPTRGTGVGLANINERLAMLYPGQAQLVVTANQPSGTLCTIELPYRVTQKTTA